MILSRKGGNKTRHFSLVELCGDGASFALPRRFLFPRCCSLLAALSAPRAPRAPPPPRPHSSPSSNERTCCCSHSHTIEFGWNHPVGFEGDAAGPRSAGAPAGSEVEKAIAGYIEKLGLRSDVGWYIGINSRRVAAIMCSTPSDTGFEKWWTAEATAARAAEMEMEEE